MSPLLTTLSPGVLAEFCQHWQIQELAVFGSAVRDDFRPDSDVDILVTFAPEADWGLFDHIQMQQDLQKIVQRPVDLLTKRALAQSKNWLRRAEILKTARVLFPQSKALHAS